jgi:hypothetical protein
MLVRFVRLLGNCGVGVGLLILPIKERPQFSFSVYECCPTSILQKHAPSSMHVSQLYTRQRMEEPSPLLDHLVYREARSAGTQSLAPIVTRQLWLWKARMRASSIHWGAIVGMSGEDGSMQEGRGYKVRQGGYEYMCACVCT